MSSPGSPSRGNEGTATALLDIQFVLERTDLDLDQQRQRIRAILTPLLEEAHEPTERTLLEQLSTNLLGSGPLDIEGVNKQISDLVVDVLFGRPQAPTQKKPSSKPASSTLDPAKQAEVEQARTELLGLEASIQKEKHLAGFWEQLGDPQALKKNLEILKDHFWVRSQPLGCTSILEQEGMSFSEKVGQITSVHDLRSLFSAFAEVLDKGVMARFDLAQVNPQKNGFLRNPLEYHLISLENLKERIDETIQAGVDAGIIKREKTGDLDRIQLMCWGKVADSHSFFDYFDTLCNVYLDSRQELPKESYDLLAANLRAYLLAFTTVGVFSFTSFNVVGYFNTGKKLIYYREKSGEVKVMEEDEHALCELSSS